MGARPPPPTEKPGDVMKIGTPASDKPGNLMKTGPSQKCDLGHFSCAFAAEVDFVILFESWRPLLLSGALVYCSLRPALSQQLSGLGHLVRAAAIYRAQKLTILLLL